MSIYCFSTSSRGSGAEGQSAIGGSPEIRDGSTAFEVDSLLKMEVAVTGSELEGFYGLLRGAMLHSSVSPAPPPHKKVHHTPSATISHLPPHESTGPDVCESADQAMKAVSPAAPPASEEAIPAHMQPLHIQLGASNEYTNARLRDARRPHQPPMLLFAHMYAKCTWG